MPGARALKVTWARSARQPYKGASTQEREVPVQYLKDCGRVAMKRVGSLRGQPITLDARPVEEEILSASEFLRLTKQNPSIIKASSPIAPRVGRREFGRFLVQYTHPLYKAEA